MKKLLIIFVKNPELGRVKTRLAKSLGDEAALAIYLRLLTHTQEITDTLNVDRAVYYSHYIDTEDNWDNGIYKKYLQKGANLGERMCAAMENSFSQGYEAICLVGTDIYELKPEVLSNAFLKLENNDVVIGPAKDGGYYLIGMTKLQPRIFDLQRWSTPNVFSETIKLIEKEKLSYGQTRLLNDIDEPEDLKGTDLENML